MSVLNISVLPDNNKLGPEYLYFTKVFNICFSVVIASIPEHGILNITSIDCNSDNVNLSLTSLLVIPIL